MFDYLVLAYRTRRHHIIRCEDDETLRLICERRFGYTPVWMDYGGNPWAVKGDGELWHEPNWGIRRIVDATPLHEKVDALIKAAYDMRF